MLKKKPRLLCILEILRRYSDENHYLSAEAINGKLKELYDLPPCNRKTIYREINALINFGYNVESFKRKGFSLTEAPFSLAEIKIMSDLSNAFKNLDEETTVKLQNKLFSYISHYEEAILLNSLTKSPKRAKKSFIYFLSLALDALHAQKYLLMPDKNGEEKEIIPFFLTYKDNYYYLYYGYKDYAKRNYHIRFDHIKSLKLSEKRFITEVTDYSQRCQRSSKQIKESVTSFHSEDSENVHLLFKDEKDFIKIQLEDRFSEIIFNRAADGRESATFKANINNDFYGFLLKFGVDIEIAEPASLKANFLAYLEKVEEIYRKKDE